MLSRSLQSYRHETQTQRPAIPPLSLAAAKAHLRVTTDAEDELIRDYVASAVEFVESAAGVQMITATWTLEISELVGDIILGVRPVREINNFTYVDASGATIVLDSSDYVVRRDLVGATTLSPVGSWPATANDRSPVATIVYSAGFGDSPEDVPSALLQAVRLLAAHWYEHREAVVTGTIESEVGLAVREILRQYRLVNI